ncbi:helix-turn-helix domain-containing protein [Pelagibacteraceae bacterium]|nr:helix-turn-helix domain-containing protein [Pelagibacteraceae bacterium]
MKPTLPIPVRKALRNLGEDMKNARRRRRISTALMAERADISRTTLAKIEKGDSGVSLGNYATVLFVLGLVNRLSELVDISQDHLGQDLEDENLPKRIRIKKLK